MTTSTSNQQTQPPAIVRDFLAAHAAHDVDVALHTFCPTAVVVDEGQTFRGTVEIMRFLSDAGAQFTYTSTLTGAQRVDDDRWVADIRLEGNFPGGTADLKYRFTLAADLIAELVIAP